MIDISVKAYRTFESSGSEWMYDEHFHYTDYSVMYELYSSSETLPISPVALRFLNTLIKSESVRQYHDTDALDCSEKALSNRKTWEIICEMNYLYHEQRFGTTRNYTYKMNDILDENEKLFNKNISTLEMVKLNLLKVNEINPFNRCYPLDVAIIKQDPEMFRLLMEEGAILVKHRNVLNNIDELYIVELLLIALKSCKLSLRNYYIIKELYFHLLSNNIHIEKVIKEEYKYAIVFKEKGLIYKIFEKYKDVFTREMNKNGINPYTFELGTEWNSSQDYMIKFLIEDYIYKICRGEYIDEPRDHDPSIATRRGMWLRDIILNKPEYNFCL